MKTQKPHLPSLNEERQLWLQGYKYVVGIDEVGRGAFAGPVVAAAVIFSPCVFPCTDDFLCSRCSSDEMKKINDSKLLLPHKRETLSDFIRENVLAYSIAEVPVQTINRIGIGKASHIAYRKVVRSILNNVKSSMYKHTTNYLLHNRETFILMDGFRIQGIAEIIQKPIIKGDQKSISIAAASIIAKVYRDSLMSKLPEKYSVYKFAMNKGYGTKYHQEAIKQYGLSNQHRTSFNLQHFL